MKTKKAICAIVALSAFGSASSLLAFNATFNASDTAYDWSDVSIWDTVPNANGNVVISAGETTGSSITIDALDLSTYTLNTKLNDNTVFNITNGASYSFGHGSAALALLGNSKLNVDNAKIAFGTFNVTNASGTSEFTLKNGATVGGGYASFFFSENSKYILDGVTDSKNLWNGIKFSDNATFELKNASKFELTNRHSGSVLFTDNSVLSVGAGSSFVLSANIPALVLEKNAQINLSGVGASVTAGSGIITQTAEDSTVANVKINVTNGAAFSPASVTLTGTSSLNYTSLATDENATTGTLSGISLIDNTSLNISGSQTAISATGTYTGTLGATMNISDGAIVTRGNALFTLAGDLVTTVSNKARLDMGHVNGLYIQDNAKLVIDGAYLGLKNYPIITATGGELEFKNGGTLSESGRTTSTSGMFGFFLFSGNSKLTMNDTSVSGGFVSNQEGNLKKSTFAGTSIWTINNSTFKDNGFGTFTNGLEFSDSASLVIKNASSFTWKNVDTAVVSAIGNASISVSGESSFTAREVSVGASTGASKLILSGSNNSFVATTKFSLIGAAGTTFSNQLGGRLSFVADADGVSTLQAGEISAFSGILDLDFSAFNQEGTYEFVIVAASSDWSDLAANYVTDSTKSNALVNVTKANDGDSWAIDYADGNLVLNYTYVVPEPSTYAAIFGALALALAFIRRNSKKN